MFNRSVKTETSDDDTVELTENNSLELVVNVPDPLSDLEESIRALRKLQKRFSAREDVERGLRMEVADLRDQIAKASSDGRDDDVQDLARKLKNVNNNIDRQADKLDAIAAELDLTRQSVQLYAARV